MYILTLKEKLSYRYAYICTHFYSPSCLSGNLYKFDDFHPSLRDSTVYNAYSSPKHS